MFFLRLRSFVLLLEHDYIHTRAHTRARWLFLRKTDTAFTDPDCEKGHYVIRENDSDGDDGQWVSTRPMNTYSKTEKRTKIIKGQLKTNRKHGEENGKSRRDARRNRRTTKRVTHGTNVGGSDGSGRKPSNVVRGTKRRARASSRCSSLRGHYQYRYLCLGFAYVLG